MRLKTILTAAVAAAATFLSPVTIPAAENSPASTTPPLELQKTGKAAFRGGILGVPDSPVTVAEYGDLQCPNSAKAAADYFPRIERDFLASVRYEFRAFPHDFHPQAIVAEVAARCAGEQEKYQEFRQRLLASQGPVTPGSILGLAGDLSLDTQTFQDCLVRGDHADAIRRQKADGEKIGVLATPTYVIFTGAGKNEQRVLLKNPKTYDEIHVAIEQARQQTGVSRPAAP